MDTDNVEETSMRMSPSAAVVALTLAAGVLPDPVGAQEKDNLIADRPLPPTVRAAESEFSVSSLMGKQVVDAAGDSLGQISDVIVNAETGRVDRLVISSGGVWGIGDEVVAVGLDDVVISPREGKIIAPGLTKSEIERYSEGAPE